MRGADAEHEPEVQDAEEPGSPTPLDFLSEPPVMVDESQSEEEEEPSTRPPKPLSKKEKAQDMVLVVHFFLFIFLLSTFRTDC